MQILGCDLIVFSLVFFPRDIAPLTNVLDTVSLETVSLGTVSLGTVSLGTVSLVTMWQPHSEP